MMISDPLLSASGGGPVRVSPGIGVGVAFDPSPSIEISSLSRYRMRTDRAALKLRAGETVLCAAYEPVDLGMVVLVRCESDGHSPGVLIPDEDVDYIGPYVGPMDLSAWHRPGRRSSS